MKYLFALIFLLQTAINSGFAQNKELMYANSSIITNATLKMHKNFGHYHDDDFAALIDICFQNPDEVGYTVQLARNIVLPRMSGVLVNDKHSITTQNQIWIDSLYAQTVAKGNLFFTAHQRQVLWHIAHQCPELGGNAVHRARSLYSLIGYELYNTDCVSLPQTRLNSVDSCHEDVNFPNPSLEGTPPFGSPDLWVVCENSPDIQPWVPDFIQAADGLTYVGLGTDPSFSILESIGGDLVTPLYKNKTYKFLFDLATPKSAMSPFLDFGSISIWLGNSICSKEQLVYSASTSDSLWGTHLVSFVPNENYIHMVISSEYYSTVNGDYAFIDNLRPIVCDTMDTVVTPPIDTFHVVPYHEHTEYEEDILVGVEEISIERFNIYPNPNTQGQLTVEWARPLPKSFPQEGKDFLIVIVDALGRQVAAYGVAAGATMQVIDIQQLASGFYTVLLQAPLSKSLPKGERLTIARGKLVVLRE